MNWEFYEEDSKGIMQTILKGKKKMKTDNLQ